MAQMKQQAREEEDVRSCVTIQGTEPRAEAGVTDKWRYLLVLFVSKCKIEEKQDTGYFSQTTQLNTERTKTIQ